MRQVQLVCEFANNDGGSMTQKEVPVIPDTEKSCADLKARLANTIVCEKSFKPEQFDGADARDVTFPAGPDKTMSMKGQQFLSNFSLPKL